MNYYLIPIRIRDTFREYVITDVLIIFPLELSVISKLLLQNRVRDVIR